MRYVVIAAWIVVVAGVAPAADAPQVRVHLPRTVRVEADAVTLGDLCAIRCADETSRERAAGVAMGRGPQAGERIVIDRGTVLSRLATAGLSGDRVRLTGADAVAVTRDETGVESGRILAAAEKLLTELQPGPPGSEWRPAGEIRAMLVPAGEAFELRAERLDDAPRDYVRVRVTAAAGERTLATRDVLFRLRYLTRRAVATENIRAGERITPANARIETVRVDRRPLRVWRSPYGETAATAVDAGRQITPGMIRDASAQIALRRGQAVTLKIETKLYVVTATGEAMENGRVGDLIKVRNARSERIVHARVMPDGTVEPLFERSK